MSADLLRKEFDAVAASVRIAEKAFTYEQLTALVSRIDVFRNLAAVFVDELAPKADPFEVEVNKFLAEVSAAGSNKDARSIAVDNFVTALGKL